MEYVRGKSEWCQKAPTTPWGCFQDRPTMPRLTNYQTWHCEWYIHRGSNKLHPHISLYGLFQFCIVGCCLIRATHIWAPDRLSTIHFDPIRICRLALNQISRHPFWTELSFDHFHREQGLKHFHECNRHIYRHFHQRHFGGEEMLIVEFSEEAWGWA